MRTGKAISNNGGYSLVELIVSILIMALIGGIVVALISSSRKTYEVVSTDAVIQEETEAVRSFINELAIEAKDCSNDSSGAISCGGSDTCIWIKAPDNHVGADETFDYYYYYFIFYEASAHVLRYTRVQADAIHDIDTADLSALLKTDEDTKIFGDDYCLLAQHINYIGCKKDGNLIKITLEVEFNGQKEEKNMVFTGRNM